jgi:signal peptidase II
VSARADQRAHLGLFLLIAAAGALWDLFTKWLAFTLVGAPEIPGAVGRSSSWAVLPGVFSFTTSYNRGALWGFGDRIVTIPHSNTVFAVLSFAAALAILYWVLLRGAARSRLLATSLGLILAGTIGNCYDRLVHPGVRDFLYFELINWPIFNFADTFLVCGALLLMLHAFLYDLADEGEPSEQASVSSSAEAEVQ